jgi:hypothetical protein
MLQKKYREINLLLTDNQTFFLNPLSLKIYSKSIKSNNRQTSFRKHTDDNLYRSFGRQIQYLDTFFVIT